MRKFFAVLSCLFVCLVGSYAAEFALVNGDFESCVQNFFNGFDGAFYDVPGWKDIEPTSQSTDSGVEAATAWWGTYDGYSAFIKSSATGNDPGIYQISGHTVQYGDEITVGFYAKGWLNGNSGAELTVTLFAGSSLASNTVVGIYNTGVLPRGDDSAWVYYECTILAPDDAVGQLLGIQIENTCADANTHANLDEVTIDVENFVEVHYVDANSVNPVSPYTNWVTAAVNIQDAVDVTTRKDTVLVADGVYDFGVATVPAGRSQCRVMVTNDIVVRSVHGPSSTFIVGAPHSERSPEPGYWAVRGVYMSAGELSGFTISNGYTMASGDADYDRSGGGINLFGGDARVYNCLVTDCVADLYGGGAFGGSFHNCMLSGNAASLGGGVANGTLYNGTVVENTAASAGGSYNSLLFNSIVTSNEATVVGDNWVSGMFSFCCTTPEPSGNGNMTNAPLFMDAASGDYRLQASSPGVDAGDSSFVLSSVDMLGNARIFNGTVDLGATEWVGGDLAVTISAAGAMAVGETHTVTVVIQNNGGAVSNAFAVFSHNGGSDLSIIASNNTPVNLDAHGSTTNTFDVTVNSGAGGGYVLTGQAFADGGVEGGGTVVDMYVGSRISYESCSVSTTFVGAVGLFVGEVEPGETNTIVVTSVNDGAESVSRLKGTLLSSEYFDVISIPAQRGVTLAVGNDYSLSYRVVCAEDTPHGQHPISVVNYNTSGLVWTNELYVDVVHAAKLVMSDLTVTVAPGESVTNTMAVSNIGNRDGMFAVSADARIPVRYSFESRTNRLETFSVTPASFSVWDGTSTGLAPVGFSFHLFGTEYSDFSVNQYGSITLETADGTQTASVVPFDLDAPVAASSIRYLRDGDRLVIAWNNNSVGTATGPEFQAILNADGTLEFAYASGAWTEGVIGVDAGRFRQVEAHTPGDDWLLRPVPWVTFPTNGVLGGAGSSTNLEFVADASAWEFAEEERLPFSVLFSSGDSSVTTTVTVVLDGDSDDDGMEDAWEISTFGDLQQDGDRDYDGDGYSNVDEFIRGTDPLDSSDFSMTHYVNARSVAPVSPYASWETAARTIQDAVDVAVGNDDVLVTNGVYKTGSRAATGYSCLNRVVITDNILVHSVNGPDASYIVGAAASGGGNGAGAVRGVYMSSGVLSGFTITNGYTEVSGVTTYDSYGGGVNMYGGGGLVTNCVLSGNSAYSGGGSAFSTLIDCILIGNTATYGGGGSRDDTLVNCLIVGNTGGTYAGGTYYSTLYNCTVSGNSAGNSTGGSRYGELHNSIVYFNTVQGVAANWYSAPMDYCCTTPLSDGLGNLAGDPLFVDASAGNYRLQAGSPCVNAGLNDYAFFNADLDGKTRLFDGAMDMGAYELLSDDLNVLYGDMVGFGWEGGPFSPENQTYILFNLGENSLSWVAEWSASWLTVSQSSGTLPAGGSVEVTVSLTAEAESLVPGTYTDTLLFRNLTSGGSFSRAVELEVGERVLDHFEFDAFNDTQYVNEPFRVTVSAIDQTGKLFTNYTDSADLDVFLLNGASTVSNTLEQLDNCFAPNVLEYEFSGLPAPAGDGVIIFDVNADLDNSAETLLLEVEGEIVTTLFVDGGLQMTPVSTTVDVTEEQLASLLSDGMVSMVVTPSDAVNDLSGTERVTITLSYPSLSIGDAVQSTRSNTNHFEAGVWTGHIAVVESVYGDMILQASNDTGYSGNSALFEVVEGRDPAPELVHAANVYLTGVRVLFSEPIGETGAENIANYFITYDGGTLSVIAAELLGDGVSVLLTTAVQVPETLYTLHVSNIQDLAVNPHVMAADSQVEFLATLYSTDDIGAPSVPGSVLWTDTGGTMTAAGSGLGGTSDQMSFSHQTYTGDFDVQVRIDSMEFLSQWAQAGLMARDGLGATNLFAAAFTTPGPAGCRFMSRSVVGGSASEEGYFPTTLPNMWLRLRRTGNLFEGFAGMDGQTWEQLGSSTIAMSTDVDVGFFVASTDSSTAIATGFCDAAAGRGDIVSHIELPFEPLGPSSRRGSMVISEIMVDAPAGWGGTNSLEFVEIYNTGLITEDLTGHRFTGEIDYTFPAGTTLAPGQFLVVAKDPAAASTFYGIDCLGPYDGKLANSGGMLRFRNEIDGILLEVNYDNKEPWPVAAFGSGHSLVLSHPSYGENDPRAWSASDVMGGSPGTFDGYGFEPARGVVINECLAHTDLPQVDYIELFNTGASDVDLSGAWLSDAVDTNKFRIPDGTVIPARGFAVFDQNELGFALSADGEQVYLVNSNLTRVIDAMTFRGQANGIPDGRWPDGAPGFQALKTASKGSANAAPLQGPVVINEIMYNPVSDSNNDEYIELYNRTEDPVDMSSWKLQGGISYQFPEGTVLPADGYVVVAENATNLIAKYSQLTSANTFGNYGGTLGNGGDSVRVSMPEDLIATNEFGVVETNIFYIAVDEVIYLDGGRWGMWSDGGGSSLELIDPDADNRQSAVWADSDESGKAPWTTIDVTKILENGQAAVDEGTPYGQAGMCNRLELFLQGEGEAVIDNVQFLDNDGVNLVQNGDFSSGAANWSFGGVVRDSYIDSGMLHLVSAARGDTGCNKAYNSLSTLPSINGSSKTGTIRANVQWQKGSQYILLRLRGNWMEVPYKLNVPSDCGTPGLANSRRVANAGPAVYDVLHSPALPDANEDVVVAARASDPDGVASMTLNYRVDPSVSFTSLSMNDSGIDGDAVAGDGLYSATIAGQAADKLVAFYVSASDGSAAATFPATVPERECLVRWGEPQFTGGLGTYYLWVTAATLSEWGSREINANDTLDGTFVYGNGRVVYNVDTMYSASPFHTPAYNGPLGSFACDYEINFHAGEQFLGSEPFVLNAEMVNDNFWFDNTTQNDMTVMWVARKLGQQYNHRRHVHMVVNGQERGDIYLDTQQPNSEMLDEYYPNDSQEELRKIESWFEFANNFENQGSVYARIDAVEDSSGNLDPKWYRWQWRPRATSNPENWFNLTNLIAAVNDSAAPDWEARVDTWMNVRDFFRPIVAHHICGNWDSYAYSRGKNMYAYKPDGKGWKLLMWDAEISFSKGDSAMWNNLYTSVDSTLFNMMQSIPAFEREYLMAYQEAVDSILLPGVANPILDERYDNLVANGVFVTSPDAIKTYLATRRSMLQNLLPTASFAVDGESSFAASANHITLTGTAPLQVDEIWVNGVEYPLTWTSTTTWSLTVPLSNGVNNLSIVGVDRFDEPVGGAEASMMVAYTGGTADPAGTVVFSEIHPSPEDRSRQFVELHNTSSSEAFDLAGWKVNGISHTFDAGDVIQPGEYLLLVEDSFLFADQYPQAIIFDDYDGSLDPDGETLTLLRPGATTNDAMIVVDRVRYEGRSPWASIGEGSSLQLIDASRDNSRVGNWGSNDQENEAIEPVAAVAMDDVWSYYQSGLPGADWETAGFDDAAWPTGNALLYVENAVLPADKNTALTIGRTTYYFRNSFTYSGGDSNAVLDLTTLIDDGAVVYLNGEEILRVRIDNGAVSYDTLANTVVDNANTENYRLPADALVIGTNVLAVEVHQVDVGSSDVVFGMSLEIVDAGTTTTVTPGAVNSVTNALPVFPTLWLNELQAENSGGDPWVELYNPGASEISLDGYYLTADYGSLTNWAFPTDASVPAGGALVVVCDGQIGESTALEPHTDFVLPASAGQIGLARMLDGEPQIVDYLTYTNLPANWSYGDVPDAQPFYRANMFYATPGATNNGASVPITVSINEWMADNDGTFVDTADGSFDDWIELYNYGSETVDLGGYFLTDDLENPDQFEVPNNGQYTIEPGGYLLVWADDDAEQNTTNSVDLHVNFKLGKGGEAIGLFGADGVAIDSVTFGAQTTDKSEGRYPDAAAGIFAMDESTPLAANIVANTAPELDPIADATLIVGQMLSFTVVATDADTPAQTLTYSLANAPVGATIHPSSGAFRWTPGTAPSTNLMAVVVADSGTPAATDTEWFTVVVASRPMLRTLSVSGADLRFSWDSIPGQTYYVCYKEHLDDPEWIELPPVSGTGGSLNYTNSLDLSSCFFSIRTEE